MQRKYIPLLIAAILGSAITLGIYFAFGFENRKKITIEHVSSVPATNAMYTTNDKGEVVPLDFTATSKAVMDAVVHIRSSVTVQRGGTGRTPQLPEHFRDFFDDDMFEYFFGPRNQQRNLPPEVRMGAGSGVIINEEGYIVTNNHVIAQADEIQVTLYDNRSYKANVVGTDPSTDLALIKIDEKDLPTIPIVNSDNIEVGNWVLAVGNPFNLTSTVTAGIVSAKARNINILRDQYAIESFIQTDAAINPGNSGGALVNLQGGLVGINTAIASPTGAYTGYGFAVPSNMVSKVVEDILEYGSVQRGYLGVTIRNITGDFAREEDLSVTEGVYIDSVLSESAAEKAGIRKGDVVTSINGTNVTKASELQELIARNRPGDKVEFTVLRNGKERKVTATLQSREGTTELASKDEGEISTKLGAELQTIDKKLARKLNIGGGVKIVRLHSGKLRRNTDVREGFIITRVNGEPVSSVEELTEMLKDKTGGVMLEGVYEDVPGTYYYAFGL